MLDDEPPRPLARRIAALPAERCTANSAHEAVDGGGDRGTLLFIAHQKMAGETLAVTAEVKAGLTHCGRRLRVALKRLRAGIDG
jgi:hypothetical protein